MKRPTGIVAPRQSREALREAWLRFARHSGGEAVRQAARAFDGAAGQLVLGELQ